MQKILFPTDFSEQAKKVLPIAADIAVKNNAQLEVLHVNMMATYVPVMPEMYTLPLAEINEYEMSAANDLKNLKRDILNEGNYKDLPVETRIETGSLHGALNRIAAEDGCDLIVMGTKGASDATEFFIGSNTERVIRTAKCPVLAVPEGNSDFNPKKVVLPTTLRADQKEVFRVLAEWQKYYDFEVKVLTLNNPGGFPTDEAAEAALEVLCKEAQLRNVDMYTASSVSNEEQAILKFAAQEEADMIAMGTHQRRGISHMLFGSIAEDTANHSKIPVLCVPLSA
jgi:nucleotide-binding universal stress UspA family protein